MTKKLLIALGSVAAIALPYAAGAYDEAAPATAPTAAPLEAAPAAAEVSDAQLQEFVKVEQQVRQVSQEYQQKLTQTQNEAEIGALAQEANAQMTQIVEQSPLSVEEYNKIASLVSTDPQLQQKYQQYHRN